MSTLERIARRLRVHGSVQGVGFRPAVCRLASALHLDGWVCNDGVGVLIHLEGPYAKLDAFRHRLTGVLPSAARIEAFTEEAVDGEAAVGFHVCAGASRSDERMTARVPADRAMCGRCRAEIFDTANRRFRHPFASCTDCGPRLSILLAMPYERDATSMAGFAMCASCAAEYRDVADRRFHAEPIACPRCGPRLSFRESTTLASEDWLAIVATAEELRAGRIVALKGLGGYQFLVRADDDAAVARLRARKRRPTKPLAVMVGSMEHAERVACILPLERELLVSAENPIVLAESRRAVSSLVAPNLGHIGVLLPTTPLHALLLSLLAFPVIATSGNHGEEPIAIDEVERVRLDTIADAFLDHYRPIMRRVDDSVVRVIDGKAMTIRLARGLAPCVVPALEELARAVDAPPMLAVGGQQKVALALWSGSQAILGPHLGDMDHPEARNAFDVATRDLAQLYRCEPAVLIGDLHPDYHTTRWAQSSSLPFFRVQHHHAHAAACMAEHSLLDREVLGVIFDGTGFGDDGTIWGGEIIQATSRDFKRVASLDTIVLPGGEAAIHEPTRTALSVLGDTYGWDAVPAWLLDRLEFEPQRASGLVRMIERDIHSPRTSSVGRLFDAVAALLLRAHKVSYEGEAALWLEATVDPDEASAYAIGVRVDRRGLLRGDWRPVIRGLVADIADDVTPGVCAARFHNALANWSAAVAASSPCGDVVLGGGCFQNAYLTVRTRAALESLGKTVHVPARIPANDGGLAVGQLVVALARWQNQRLEDPCVLACREKSSTACR